MEVEAKAEKERTVSSSIEKLCKVAADKDKFEKVANLMIKMVPHESVSKSEGGVEVYKFLSLAMNDPLRCSRTTAMKALYGKLFTACLAKHSIFTVAELAQVHLWQELWMTLRTVTLTDDSYEFPKATKSILKKIGELPAYSEEEDQYRGVHNSLEGAYRPGAAKIAPRAPRACMVKQEEPEGSPRRSPRLVARESSGASLETIPAVSLKEEGGEPDAPPPIEAKPAEEEEEEEEGGEEEEEEEEEEEDEEEDVYAEGTEETADSIFTSDMPMPEKKGEESDPVVKERSVEEQAKRKRKREERETAKNEIKARRAEKEEAQKVKLTSLRERREQRRDAAQVNTCCLKAQRRHALFEILKAVKSMYKFNWAKTSIDILLKAVAQQYLDRFAPEHRQLVSNMYHESSTSQASRAQDRNQMQGHSSAGEAQTSFDAADKLWAKTNVSKRGALVGGGRVAQGGESGKMFGQNDP